MNNPPTPLVGFAGMSCYLVLCILGMNNPSTALLGLPDEIRNLAFGQLQFVVFKNRQTEVVEQLTRR